jgi:hypothetical protein
MITDLNYDQEKRNDPRSVEELVRVTGIPCPRLCTGKAHRTESLIHADGL